MLEVEIEVVEEVDVLESSGKAINNVSPANSLAFFHLPPVSFSNPAIEIQIEEMIISFSSLLRTKEPLTRT